MKKLLVLGATLLMMTSCSTVINGSKQNLRVRSESGERIRVLNEYGNEIASGNGEVNVSVNKGNGFFRSANYTIETSKEKLIVDSKLNIGAFIVGNLFVPGWWGYIVDGATGAMYDLEVNGQPTGNLTIK